MIDFKETGEKSLRDDVIDIDYDTYGIIEKDRAADINLCVIRI